jgi:hypothetical protein
LERVVRVELTITGWKPVVLPLHHTRVEPQIRIERMTS